MPAGGWIGVLTEAVSAFFQFSCKCQKVGCTVLIIINAKL